MPIDITMPRLSDQMEEATIARWLKSVGDLVNKGGEFIEVETDKATVVYEAEDTGDLAAVTHSTVLPRNTVSFLRYRGLALPHSVLTGSQLPRPLQQVQGGQMGVTRI